MKYFVENLNGTTGRIVTGSDLATVQATLGSTWIETVDPTDPRSLGVYPMTGTSTQWAQPPFRSGATIFPRTNGSKVIDTPVYTAWPYNHLHWDEARQKMWFMYTQGSAHLDAASDNKSVYYVEINPDTGQFGTPKVVAPFHPGTPTESCTSHSSIICPNGNYLMHNRYTRNGITQGYEQWRSVDGGINWVYDGPPIDQNGQPLGISFIPHGMLVTQAGTMIGSSLNKDDASIIVNFRSTDNGTHFTPTESLNPLTGTSPLEPGFFQDPVSGRIIAVWRMGQSGSTSRGGWNYSDDDGITWSDMQWMPAHLDMYSNPTAILYHADDDVVELFYGTRNSYGGKARIQRATASAAEAVVGNWSGGDPIVTDGSPTNNFGYVAAERVGSKVFVLWYNGGDTDTDIYMTVGTRP